MLNNKRGQFTAGLFFLIFIAIFGVLFIAIGGMVVVHLNNILSQDLQMGQVNLQDLNEETFGVYYTTYINNADWWSMSLIFGMILGLFISAYIIRGKFPKFGIILDILIIVSAFIVSLSISSTFQIIMDALASAGETFLESYSPLSSMFILNLPVFIVIIGVIIMILFHSSIPKRVEENYQKGGYLQGV